MAVVRAIFFLICLGFLGCFFPTRKTSYEMEVVAWRLQQEHLERMKKDREYYEEQELMKAAEQELTDPQEK